MRRTKLLTTAFALLLSAQARVALAVDETGVRIGDRWSVVGVIAAGGGKSVAVLRHNPSQKTFTLSIGDALPAEAGFVLKAVHGRTVDIAKGARTVTIAFAEGSTDDPAAEAPSRTTRFLDAYYRGLHDTPDDAALDGDAPSGDNSGHFSAPTYRRFPTFEEARTRYELYRSGRSYRLGDSEAGGFNVNYDNFEDDVESGEPPVTPTEAEGTPAATTTFTTSAALPPLPPLNTARRAKANESDEGLEESTPDAP